MPKGGRYDPAALLVLIWGEHDDDCTIAARLGVGRAQVLRWRKGTVRLDQYAADRLAIRAGYHPSLVWGQQWWDCAPMGRRKGRR